MVIILISCALWFNVLSYDGDDSYFPVILLVLVLQSWNEGLRSGCRLFGSQNASVSWKTDEPDSEREEESLRSARG